MVGEQEKDSELKEQDKDLEADEQFVIAEDETGNMATNSKFISQTL